jgi:hypothetical protein
MIRWDDPGHLVWNLSWGVVWATAVVSLLRTPKSSFAAVGWGKYWLAFWVVAGIGLWVDGYAVLPMPIVWWAYWRPRLRRVVDTRAVAATPSA